MSLDIVPVQSERRMLVGEELRLRFRLFDADNGRPPERLDSLRVLVYQPADGRQGHGWARPIGPGFYEVAFPVPRAGVYYLFFACPNSQVGYGHLPHLILQTSEAGTTTVCRSTEAASTVFEC